MRSLNLKDWNWIPNSNYYWKRGNNRVDITKIYEKSKRFILCSLIVIFLLNGIVFSILYIRFKFNIPFTGIYTKLEIIGFIVGLLGSIPLSINVVNRRQSITVTGNQILITNGLIKKNYHHESTSSFFIEKGYIGGRQAHHFQKMKLKFKNGKIITVVRLAAPVNDGLYPLLKEIHDI